MYEVKIMEAVCKDGIYEGIDDMVDMETYTICEIMEARSFREEYKAIKRLTTWYIEKCHFSTVRCLQLTMEIYEVALMRKEKEVV